MRRAWVERRRPESPRAQGALARLRDKRVNYDHQRPEQGAWRVEHESQRLPGEEPGPPVAGGPFEVARRLVADYAFADPRIIRATYDPQGPLQGRDMLLEARFLVLRFHLGVRVGSVVDDQREVDGRPVRVWGWDYHTLEGHLEAGRMGYEVWKWLDTGVVEFHVSRTFRTGDIANPLVRAGWHVFGRLMQVLFVRLACRRMARMVGAEQRRRGQSPDVPSDTPAGAAIHPFRFTRLYRTVGACVGVTPHRAWVHVGHGWLEARFGPWVVQTPLRNVAAVSRTGPYPVVKTVGPAHLSLADRGLTFASNPDRGLCIRFHHPVGGMDPLHLLRHPGLTVTVADLDALERALRTPPATPDGHARR